MAVTYVPHMAEKEAENWNLPPVLHSDARPAWLRPLPPLGWVRGQAVKGGGLCPG